MRRQLAKFALVSLAALDLCPAASLAIHNAVVSELDGGPAIASRQNFQTGETIYFTFQVTGFTRKTDEDERNHVELEYRVTLKDKAGLLLDKPVQGKIVEELTPQDKEWLPKVNRSFVLPDTLVTEEYHLDIEVRDLTAKSSATHQFKIMCAVDASNRQKNLWPMRCDFLGMTKAQFLPWAQSTVREPHCMYSFKSPAFPGRKTTGTR